MPRDEYRGVASPSAVTSVCVNPGDTVRMGW